MRYALTLVLSFGFSLRIVSEERPKWQTQSVRAAHFEQKLNRRVERFDTAGRTLVANIVDLAFTYQLPTAIESADREATTRPLSLSFRNESLRTILAAIVRQVPEYRLSFSEGIVDVFSAHAREDHSNLLNTIVKDFSVSKVDTRDADFQLFCALSRDVGSQFCGGSIAIGGWGPLKVSVHLQNAKVYEILNAIVAENGSAIWTVTARPDKLSTLQLGGNWCIYSLESSHLKPWSQNV